TAETRQARLFDRSAPDKGVGIHYTDPGTIMKIIEPVVMRPWREEWDALKAEVRALNEARDNAKSPKERTKAVEKARKLYGAFRARLGKFRVLDPACGSGNFLALSLNALKDFDLKIIKETTELQLPPDNPRVGPEAVLGIEINPYAAELARLTVWITELQWQLRNGFHIKRAPILGKLDGIVCRDALINSDETEARWPEADVVVGNPPFLGTKLMYRALGQDYTERIRGAFEGRVSPFADLVCFWFEKARAQIKAGKLKRAGLVATNSIRGGRNRLVLDRIVNDTQIYNAWSDEPWVVDGAAVRVSLVCFSNDVNTSRERHLDGKPVNQIFADLTAPLATSPNSDPTKAKKLNQNKNVAFIGIQKTGPFDVPGKVARQWLLLPLNPNGRPNADVLRPHLNGIDVTRRSRDVWIVDFSGASNESDAALYEAPFKYVANTVKPERAKNKEATARAQWWLFWRPRPELRAAIKNLSRVIGTPEVAKHRLFVWLSKLESFDKNLIIIARDDNTTFGVLHSRFHEAWALRLGTSLEDRPRYTPSTTFETFPFPEELTPNIPAKAYANDPRAIAIAAAAKRLDELRRNWLNPSDLIKIEPEIVPGYPDRILPRNPGPRSNSRSAR
ncbi:MAG: class I SAM-dependent DNA methyltransferase, partial [Chthoniobacterales bacterium]